MMPLHAIVIATQLITGSEILIDIAVSNPTSKSPPKGRALVLLLK